MTASMRLRSVAEIGAADLHLHHPVALVLVAAHLGVQAFKLLAGVVVAAARIDQDSLVRLTAVEALGQQLPQRFAGDLRHGIPYRHVEPARRVRAVAVAARLLIGHEAFPDRERVQVAGLLVNEGFRDQPP